MDNVGFLMISSRLCAGMAEARTPQRALKANGAAIVTVTHSPNHADPARHRIDMANGRIVISIRNGVQ